jgi:hypothetical protein
MRRLFPIVLSGMMAVSFSQLAAAQSAGAKGSADAGANVELNKGSAGATTSTEQGSSAGATGERMNPDSKSKDKDKKKQRNGNASGGATGKASQSADSPARPGDNSGPNTRSGDARTGDTQARQDNEQERAPAKSKY